MTRQEQDEKQRAKDNRRFLKGRTKRTSWAKIDGFKYYIISSTGKVKSLSRKVKINKNHRITVEKILTYKPRRDGYYTAVLRDKGRTKYAAIHRLVALAFVPNQENKPEVNHKDGNKKNNNASNLEWATSAENVKHAYANGLNHGVSGKDHPLSKPILQIDLKGNIKARFESTRHAEKLTGVNSKSINKVCNGYKYRKTAGGFKWCFE